MSEIKITHQGFDITYAENENVWRCWKLNVEDKSLTGLRQKINKMISKALKDMSLECFVINEYGGSEITKARITSRDAKTGEFWIVKEGNERRARVKGQYLRPWTTEIEETLAEVKRIQAEGYDLIRKSDALRKSIKPLTQEQLEAFLADLMQTVEAETE